MAAERSPYFFFVHRSPGGEWHWRFYGPGNRHLADGAEGYASKDDCVAAINVICHQATTGLTIEYAPSASGG